MLRRGLVWTARAGAGCPLTARRQQRWPWSSTLRARGRVSALLLVKAFVGVVGDVGLGVLPALGCILGWCAVLSVCVVLRALRVLRVTLCCVTLCCV